MAVVTKTNDMILPGLKPHGWLQSLVMKIMISQGLKDLNQEDGFNYEIP